VAVRTLPEPGAGAETAAPRGVAAPLGGAVLALCLPLVFLHVDFQPDVTLSARGVRGNADLSDLAILVVAASGLFAGLRLGFRPLRAGLPIWIAGGALLTIVVAASFYPLLGDDPYAWKAHLPTALKFVEYALLAAAVPLLVRRRADAGALLLGLATWSAAATAVGLVQFFGWRILDAYPAGRRQPSFVGHHDFAALSGAALAAALVAIVLGPSSRLDRRIAIVAGVSGWIGLVLSGSTAGAIGLAAAALAAGLVAWRRTGLSARRALALAAVAGTVVAGVLLQRGGDFDQLLRALGVRDKREDVGVQTYVQRTLLAYIGWRIFLDHPAVGAGWQASVKEPSTYTPYLADAHREFPDAPELAFPTPAHPWGIQNAYVQALADLGVLGLLAFLWLLASGLWVATRPALRAPPDVAAVSLVAGAWLLVAMGVWTALGLVAGIPLDGLMWMALGLAVAGAARARSADA
jgi:O-antigen ligase